jgi:hypothetical protein
LLCGVSHWPYSKRDRAQLSQRLARALEELQYALDTLGPAVLRHVTARRGRSRRSGSSAPIRVQWTAPNGVTASDAAPPAATATCCQAAASSSGPAFELIQDGRQLWGGAPPPQSAGAFGKLPTGWAGSMDPKGGPATVRVVRARAR